MWFDDASSNNGGLLLRLVGVEILKRAIPCLATKYRRLLHIRHIWWQGNVFRDLTTLVRDPVWGAGVNMVKRTFLMRPICIQPLKNKYSSLKCGFI